MTTSLERSEGKPLLTLCWVHRLAGTEHRISVPASIASSTIVAWTIWMGNRGRDQQICQLEFAVEEGGVLYAALDFEAVCAMYIEEFASGSVTEFEGG